MKKLFSAVMAFALAGASFAQEIVLRHQLDGAALDTLAGQVLRFNDELKGKGKVVLQDVRGVEDKRVLPHMVLFNPDDGIEFVGSRATVKPLHEIMRDGKKKLDAKAFYPQVADAVSDDKGRLLALPVGLSLPVLLVNKATLAKLAIPSTQPPTTWKDVQNLAGALNDKGVKCPLTSSQFGWIHLENVSTQHGSPVVTGKGATERAALNGLIDVKHLALLASWQKSKYFQYAGPQREGNRRFLSGECAMLTAESSVYPEAVRAGLDVMVTPLPYYDDVAGAHQNDVLMDGIGLWALAGHKKADYALVANFASFLMRPEVQKEWVKATRFLPMTPVANLALREAGFPPGLLELAERRLVAPTSNSNRMRHGPLRERLNEFLAQEVAAVWALDRAAKEALDATMEKVNLPLAAAPGIRRR